MAKEAEKDKPLRHGYTTGACATAAAKAATHALLTGETWSHVTIRIPAGMDVTFELHNLEFTRDMATCSVIKDGGDDPDATHGAHIFATVTLTDEPGIELDGGVGVGRVTKPGLALPVGAAAINPVPRKMIQEAVRKEADEFLAGRGLKVVISVPDGEEIAKKTLNSRLGILGGISILGTTGVVKPFSSSAYIASVVQAIDVAVANGCDHLVLTTGGRSERVAQEDLPQLPEVAFIQMGDFAGIALRHCAKKGVSRVTMSGMMGKFSKLAQGHMNLHARGSQVDFEFLAEVAERAGVPEELLAEIRRSNTAKQVGDLLEAAGYQNFFALLCSMICEQCKRHGGGVFEVDTILAEFDGRIIGRGSTDASGANYRDWR
ncbi:cobalt-precorrin-5B (C(1))-methyltransferase [Effusibacillus lacus]|uniref:Cobalt-precorrin-5B C(1)-methyltransferase n=1 Tax=Effusibacillus lacus TaxID=1348429 RepID=A0A292YIW3_9BACL|nr:cobalt-precorrin-5B (C(1))-methyltransferase [Effusibacillus lacus]TCS75708.1 cobalt-precorrin 5B C1-methyltransferase [Effusibacillus lacus]GAX91027.1 cobalt-precorrin-5B (C(1))-methyltransferase [Effusibacillus lacus]